MKPWPEPFEPSKQTLASYLGNVAELNYEHARAEAAIERLRVAVEALKQYASLAHASSPLALVGKPAADALYEIGDIPEQP